MKIKTTGIAEKIQTMDKFDLQFRKDIRTYLIAAGSKMTRDARSDHEFITRSGAAERSIAAEVPADKISLRFGIIGGATMTPSKGGVSYTTFLHEGTYKGYRKSEASEEYVPTTPKKGYGILADHFIVRAWNKHIDGLIKDVTSIAKSMVKDTIKGVK